MTEATLIYPHQLFADNALLARDRRVYLIEDQLFFTQFRFHIQKLLLHRASMRAYADRLLAEGYSVIVVPVSELPSTGAIADRLASDGVRRAVVHDPVDDWLERRLTRACAQREIELIVSESPAFLLDRPTLRAYGEPILARGRSLRQRDFYAWQRKRLGILVDERGAPLGGRWSFDGENRKRIPKDFPLPLDPEPNADPRVAIARDTLAREFPDAYGSAATFWYPIDHVQANAWLTSFIAERLDLFGPYEDAMTNRRIRVFHSMLSPLLNCGLLTPRDVIDAVLARHAEHPIPLASLEGFIRQVIGWREYIRMVYVLQGRTQRTSNALGAHRPLPTSFWNGTTGLAPVDGVIRTTLTHAYAHHIERLMVMGNILALCGIRPDDAYTWFMSLYIDAYDWVMVPNVYGMALYADGGLMSTKPYVSGSAYLRRMGEYGAGPWTAVWDALYWRFIGTHPDAFAERGGAGLAAARYTSLTPEVRATHAKIAQEFLDGLEK